MDLSVRNGIADLRISGPIDLAWVAALREHVGTLAGCPELRVVRLSAEGLLFCPGGDLRWMHAAPDPQAALAELATVLHESIARLVSLDAPLITRVHGPAAGAGMSLVLASDIAIAGASASFRMAYASVGLSPDGGASWLLPRLVGQRRALEIMLSDPVIDAQEAAELGIVTRAVPDGDLDAEVDRIVAQLAQGPTRAYGAIKRLARTSWVSSFEDQLAREAESIAALAGSRTGREGIAAFLEKRVARYHPD